MHPIGHLEGQLARRRGLTWWWVSPMSPGSAISPPSLQGPFRESRRGGGLTGLIGGWGGGDLGAP